MPDQYDNNMTGALFVNDKQGNDKRPDYRGTCEIQCVTFKISGWKRTTKTGEKMLSLRFEPKEQQPAQPAAAETDDSDGLGF